MQKSSPYQSLANMLQTMVDETVLGTAILPNEDGDAQVVIGTEGHRIDAGLLLQQRRLVSRHRDDVSMASGEKGELIPGRGRDQPDVVLLLVFGNDALIVHPIDDRIWREREANDRSLI